jgi:hypothetical protein
MVMKMSNAQLILKKENINFDKISKNVFYFNKLILNLNLILILENILKKTKFIQNVLIKKQFFYPFKEIGIILLTLFLIFLCKFLNQLLTRSPLVSPTINEDSELEQCLSKKIVLQDEIKMLKQFIIEGDKYVSFNA